MTDLNKYLKRSGDFAALLSSFDGGGEISAFGSDFAARCITVACCKRAVFVCSDYVTAKQAFDIISSVREDVVYLPSKDDVLTFIKSRGDNSEKRLAALGKIALGEASIVVTPAQTMVELFPSAQLYRAAITVIKKGEEYDTLSLAGALAGGGYSRVTRVDGGGQFALRGDILDVCMPGSDRGVRVEFFGDEVESIAFFDLENQTSSDKTEQIKIFPATDVFFSDWKEIAAELKKYLPKNLDADGSARINGIYGKIKDALEQGVSDCNLYGITALLPHCSLSEFCGMDRVIYDDAKQIVDNVNLYINENNSRIKSLLPQGEIFTFADKQLCAEYLAPKGGKLAFHRITSQNRIFAPKEIFNLNQKDVQSYNRKYEQLTDDCRAWLGNGYEVHLFAGSEQLARNIRAMFDQAGVGGEKIHEETLLKGAIFHEQKVVLIGTADLVAKKTGKTLRRSKKDVFTLPEVGEYVVHDKHGIGICEAISPLEMGGCVRDYLIIGYRDGDKLYVPVENMDSLSKYVAGDAPKLSKIGGAEFAKVKLKVKASLKEMAFDLLELYGERSRLEGYKYADHKKEMDEFFAAFPYVETEDQLTATAEGLADLRKGKIMDRLLCGDVGYGKTEVAMRIAYNVVLNGKQVAFISPTTILAKQHFRTLTARMGEFGVNVCSLTRFESAAEQEKNIAMLKEGKADVVCGTHRLFSKDVGFKDLGLLILDEEQRFGVEDKEKLKLLKKNVNVLTLSATPIPRTLHMSMTGIRDMSVLDTPPIDRIPVQTYVTEYTDSLLCDAVRREINRGGQVFVVYNRVANIDRFAAGISSLLPELKVSVAHGQMPENKLEEVIDDFVEGNADVLIASTIIENGIDMPRANTMIVVDSDRLGLSQLYQLRGRIGRSNRLAYVYFTYDGAKILTDTAYKRLDAITQFTSFGSGFKIAMRDLEIRGAGDVLGKQQHGHMEKVGYDMYCKLLKETVEELKNNAPTEKKEVKVFTDADAFIPDGYVPDNRSRLELYSRISHVSSVDEAQSLLKDVRDIYGNLPAALKNLVYVALVKNLAAALNAVSVTFKKLEGAVTFEKVKDISENVQKEVASSSVAALKLTAKPSIVMVNGLNARKNLINFLGNCQNRR